jgi:hypothetical protein
MGHTWVNALDGAWYNTYVPTLNDYASLDALLFAMVNGDGGGTWTPATNVTVGGYGMWFAGPSTLGGGAELQTTAFKQITHNDSDYALLVNSHTGSTRTLRTSCLAAGSPSGWSLGANPGQYSQIVSLSPGSRAVVPLRMHQGATLTQAVLTLVVLRSRSVVPAVLPGIRICQRDGLGNITPLVASGGDLNGFVYFPTPSTGSAWHNAGNAQTMTYTCAPTVIDRTQYTYFAEIVDESGKGALNYNCYNDIQLTFTDIADTRPS